MGWKETGICLSKKIIKNDIDQTCCDTSSRTVDVNVNGLLAALGLEEEELRDDDAGQHVVDGSHQADDSLLQQPRVDVVGSLAAAGLLDHDRDEAAVGAVLVEVSSAVDRFENGWQDNFLLPEKHRRSLLRHFYSDGKRHFLCKNG